jgi:xanthine dehydrogenase/oxidase
LIINNSSNQQVHKPIIHQSALKQVTGEAVYVDDMPNHGLSGALVLSRVAHGRIL